MLPVDPDRGASPGRPVGTRWALAAGALLAIGAFYALDLPDPHAQDLIRSHLDSWKARVGQNLAAALLVFFLIYLAVTALSLPVAVWLTLLAGALFGRWLGTAVVSLASTLGATLAFLGSRYVLGDWVQRRFGRWLAGLNAGIVRDGAYYLFTLRLVPVVPFFLLNLGMGLTPIRTRTYVWVSWLGMLPGTFVYVNTGSALGTIASPKDIVSTDVLLALALLGLVPLALRILVRRLGPPTGWKFSATSATMPEPQPTRSANDEPSATH